MGRVWIAEHLTLDTQVVVKFMAKDIADTADGAARFAREASVAAAVKSPHVVQMFDHGVTPDGDAYIVMEMLEGHDLAAHLSKHGPMAPRDVAALVAQVAKALGKAHQVGVIHRDIKPDNIFLCDADGGELFVKLLDFGIAKRDQYLVAGSATTTGAVVGTPYYMSPEQIVGDKEIDARTDIWSLGVVAFEAMTGKRPFEGTTVGAITLAIHTGTRRITDHLPEAPRALDEWFAKACNRDPKERFQTPREASQALLAAVGDVGSSPLLRAPMPSLVGDGSDPSFTTGASSDRPDGRAATNLSSVFPVPRPSGKRPVLFLAALAAIVVLGALLVVPALLRPSETAAKLPASAAALPSASQIMPAPSSTASVAASGAAGGSDTAGATSAAASGAPGASAAPTDSAVRTTGIVTSRPAAATSARPTTRPTTTARPLKPRTRDDDDIK
jgi:serine/threonine-protein kinase